MDKSKIKNFEFLILICSFAFCIFNFKFICFAQGGDLEFTLDITSNTTALPKIFKPNIDLSGRGAHRQSTWPQGLAAGEVLDIWQKNIGFNGIYRLQYNLWEINQLAKDKESQDKLLANYESIIKKISDAGGIVILNFYGSPAGLGKVLDKKSAPWDLKAFKELVKAYIKNLSCDKRYNVWYEIWSAPDLDDFFLGGRQDYLNIYKAVASAIKELEAESKIHIPIGGPSTSWWFQNLDGNTIISPEKSLIYELIRFCYYNHLPLDFISWHAYSTDPHTGKEITTYKKTAVALIRDWLTYFHFDRDIPLIVDEWNYDTNANVLPQRHKDSYICASYVMSRLKNMYEAGIDHQVYFCLEDFQNNKENVVRNLGIFWFDPEASEYKGGPKSTYNVFRMLTQLGNEMFLSSFKLNDEFTDTIATKTQEDIIILIYNYIDPEIFRNYISFNIARLNDAERKVLLNLIKSDKLDKIMRKEIDIFGVRPSSLFANIVGIFNPFKKERKDIGATLSHNLKALLKKAQELDTLATKFMLSPRNIKIGIKNLKGNYLYQRYAIDLSCGLGCEFNPVEERELNPSDMHQEVLTLNPYSVNIIILKKKPKEVEKQVVPQAEAVTQNVVDATNQSP